MRRLSVSIVLTIAAVAAMTAAPRAELIDRVLAVVGGQLITLSDVSAALRFGLVPAEVSTDPVGTALQRLIDRRLVLTEVDRYQPPEPAPETIDAYVARVRAVFTKGVPFETALTQSGITLDQLRSFARDSLRIDAYLQERFAAAAPPTDDELVRFYREHAADFTVKGALRPFEEAREEVRAAFERQRRDAYLRESVEGLRRRGSVVVLYLPGR